MSARSGIAKAMAELIASELDGTQPDKYVNNIYGQTSNKVTHFDNIYSFPYITTTPGPETRENLPSHFTWAELTLYIRIYVENEEDAQGELESLITDLENIVDTHLNLSYNVTTSTGSVSRTTTDNNILTITTDEGLLDPNALGEIVLGVRYEKQRKN